MKKSPIQMNDEINLDKLQEAQSNLIDLFEMKKATSDAYNEAVKAVSEEVGTDAANIKKFIATVVKDKDKEASEVKSAQDFIKMIEALG
jgi:hypothetical protein